MIACPDGRGREHAYLVGPLPLRLGMTNAEVDTLVARMDVPSACTNQNVSRLNAIGLYPHDAVDGRLGFIDLSSRCHVVCRDEDSFDMTVDELLEFFAREFGACRRDCSSYVFAEPCFLVFVDGERGPRRRLVHARVLPEPVRRVRSYSSPSVGIALVAARRAALPFLVIAGRSLKCPD